MARVNLALIPQGLGLRIGRQHGKGLPVRSMTGEGGMIRGYERERLQALHELNLLDTLESEHFDRITRVAAQLTACPMALITLVDEHRQWFKSRVGVTLTEMPRTIAFCDYAIETNAVLQVQDTQRDPRFIDNPLVTENGVRFYAGAPLITHDGYAIGTVCVLDLHPRHLSDAQCAALRDLAALVMAQVDLYRSVGRVEAVTQLPNRLRFYEDLADLDRRGNGQSAHMVLIDLMQPEQANELSSALGMRHYDELVRTAARRVADEMPLSGLYQVDAVRLAAIVGAEPEQIADRVVASLRHPIHNGEVPIALNPAVVLLPLTFGSVDPNDALRAALTAIPVARNNRRRVAYYHADSDAAARRAFDLLTALSRSLETHGEMRLHYQPRYDIRAGRCTGVEALLRWQHPLLGMVPPGEFIPLVETTELIRPTTAWVIHHALGQLAAWRADGLDIALSLNVSARNLTEPDFVERLQHALRLHATEPGRLELEFTENAVVESNALASATLVRLHQLGVSLAIDDFGTGYSNLSYLKMIPAQILKIDQSFVRELLTDTRDALIVAHTIDLAHELNYRVVAEGVETSALFGHVCTLGVDEIQGYHVGRPVPAAQLPAAMQWQPLDAPERAT
jgi:EAL domain-containing protein (putative c-di-GMP-specific phosphodiesterase class I)/GAF domain-containing protein